MQLWDEARVRLQSLHVERIHARHLDAFHELGDGALVDTVFPERRQHVRDVLHEGRVRADDEHAPQLGPMLEEQERRAVQADGCLAGARAALDDERGLRRAGDQVVLVGLDRRDDVPHARVAGALELLQEKVVDRSCRVGQRAVERLVADPRQRAPARAEAATERDAARRGRRSGVEGPRGRCLPIDHQRAARVVVHPAAADVDPVGGLLGVDPPEAEPALGVLEGAKPARCPVLDRLRRFLGGGRARGSDQGLAHLVQAGVRLVEIGLLCGEIGVRHGV